MTALAQYEQARAALAEAVRIDQVLSIRDELDHVKLYARQIQDRELLADAAAFQLRAERRLGQLLLAAREAGQLAEKGRRPKAAADELQPATLKDIGVDFKLSSKAAKAAALADEAFEDLVEATRERMAAGKAIIVDPVAAAAKDADVAARRAAHAARTINGGSIGDLHQMVASGRKFGSIGSDPQWKFLTRSAAGEGRSANVHYKTEEVDKIKDLPVGQLLADDGAFYMWMVDWCPRDALALIEHYGLTHITTAFTWVKTIPNIEALILRILEGGGPIDLSDERLWHIGNGYWSRANPEQCWLATKGNPKRLYADVRQLIVAPVMEHSRKPDAWLDRIERLTEGEYLELQARRIRPGWVSWGDELEFTGVAA